MARVILATGSNGISLQLEYGAIVDAATGGAVTSSTTAVQFSTLEVWLVTTSQSFRDYSNKMVVSGTGVVPNTWNNFNLNMVANKQLCLASLTPAARPIVYGTALTIAVGVTVSGIEYTGTLSGSYVGVAPARPYSKPATPSVGIGNGTVTIAGHQRDSSKDKYWELLDIALETDGVWSTWIGYGISGGTTSASWSSGSDRRYRTRARARNNAEAGDYGTSGYWYTTPLTVANVAAARAASGSTSVNVTWDNRAQYSGEVLIYRGLNGAGRTLVHTASGTSERWVDSVPLASTATYHIVTATPQGVNKATSASSNVASVGRGYSTPNAPTSVTLTKTGATTGTIGIKGNNNTSSSSTYWDDVNYWLQVDTSDWYGDWTAAGNATAIPVTGMQLNRRYRARARSVNAAGRSGFTYSNYIYTEPTAPTGITITRTKGTNKVQIAATDASTWGTGVQVERSTNDGDSWTAIGTAPLTDSLNDEKPAIYRFSTVTPSPSIRSAYVERPVAALLTTDKDRIPGTNRIYLGTNRIRQVLLGTNRFWVDGD